jgi:hypothetical protein
MEVRYSSLDALAANFLPTEQNKNKTKNVTRVFSKASVRLHVWKEN